MDHPNEAGATTAATKPKRKAETQSTMETKRPKENTSTCSEDANIPRNYDRSNLLPLPDDVLIKIIESIPKAQWANLERVNRQFRNATLNVWHSAKTIRLDEDFIFHRKKFEDDPAEVIILFLKKLLRHSPAISELTGLHVIPEFADKVEDLYQFFRILNRFQNLERVSFKNCMSQFPLGDVVYFLTSSASRANLKQIDMSGLTVKDGFNSILEGNIAKLIDTGHKSNLKLERFWCDEVHMDELAVRNLTQLKSLSLLDGCFNPDCLAALINRSDRLEELRLTLADYSDSDTRQIFDAVADAAPRLSILEIGTHDPLSVMPHTLNPQLLRLIKIFARHDRLETLVLTSWESGCTSEIIEAIADNLPDLKSLKLHISEDCSVGSLVNLVTKLKKLETLQFSNIFRNLEGVVVKAIPANLTKLKTLIFNDEITATSADFDGLARLEHLKKLKINTKNLDNFTFIIWTQGFGRCLESLSLTTSYRQQNAAVFLGGLTNLIENASGLRHLYLESIAITDVQLLAIASFCPRLREFYFLNGDNVTIGGIQAVIRHCKQLKWLDLPYSKCSGLRIPKYRKINFRRKTIPFGRDEY